MAEEALPDSDQKKWQVTKECTHCGICYEKAPEFFQDKGNVASVTCQPITDEEKIKVASIANHCPVNAIKIV